LGAFFAPQKTGLSGGFVPPLCGVTAVRPSNPLRTNRPAPQEVNIILMINTLAADFELNFFGQKHYNC
jgi:hypothetical protein